MAVCSWLVVKNWLVHKKKKLELAARRTWKRYWVCLKGTTLLFFDSGEESAANQNAVPRHILGECSGLLREDVAANAM